MLRCSVCLVKYLVIMFLGMKWARVMFNTDRCHVVYLSGFNYYSYKRTVPIDWNILCIYIKIFSNIYIPVALESVETTSRGFLGLRTSRLGTEGHGETEEDSRLWRRLGDITMENLSAVSTRRDLVSRSHFWNRFLVNVGRKWIENAPWSWSVQFWASRLYRNQEKWSQCRSRCHQTGLLVPDILHLEVHDSHRKPISKESLSSPASSQCCIQLFYAHGAHRRQRPEEK